MLKTPIKGTPQGGNIIDGEKGIVEYVVESQEIATGGIVNPEVVVFNTYGGKLTSAKFNFTVDEVINNDSAVKSTSKYSALEEVVIEQDKKEIDNVRLQQAILDINTNKEDLK